MLVKNSVVDTANRRVTGSVTHFTLFAVMALAPAAGAIDSITNYPNPFAPLRGEVTRIRYVLDQDREVKIRIFDAFGKPVDDRTLAAGANGGRAGPNEVQWDGKTKSGRVVGMGAYLAIIEAGGVKTTIKIGAR